MIDLNSAEWNDFLNLTDRINDEVVDLENPEVVAFLQDHSWSVEDVTEAMDRMWRDCLNECSAVADAILAGVPTLR